MFRNCTECAETMDLTLRTLVFQKLVQIKNVPVLSCAKCEQNHLIDKIKSELSLLLNRLGKNPSPASIRFEEFSSLSRLIVSLKRNQRREKNLNDDQINELLDLYLLAESIQDEHWMLEIKNKLKHSSL